MRATAEATWGYVFHTCTVSSRGRFGIGFRNYTINSRCHCGLTPDVKVDQPEPHRICLNIRTLYILITFVLKFERFTLLMRL